MPETGPERDRLNPGDILIHYTGLTYEVREIIDAATGYEVSGLLVPWAVYEQQEDDQMPARRKLGRAVAEILHGTIEIKGETVPIFQVEPSQDTTPKTV